MAEPSSSDEEKEAIGKRKAKPRRWTEIEDAALCLGVQQHGEKSWKQIASKVGTRDHMQCLQRWKKVLKPGLYRQPWSAREEAVLRERVGEGDKVNWVDIASVLNRSATECKDHWKFAHSTLVVEQPEEETQDRVMERLLHISQTVDSVKKELDDVRQLLTVVLTSLGMAPMPGIAGRAAPGPYPPPSAGYPQAPTYPRPYQYHPRRSDFF